MKHNIEGVKGTGKEGRQRERAGLLPITHTTQHGPTGIRMASIK